MRQRRTRVFLLNEELVHQRRFQSAVSLHCHTLHSREGLGIIPHHASRLPVLGALIRYEMARYRSMNGRDVDFEGSYWTPPVSPRVVFESERDRIENSLDS